MPRWFAKFWANFNGYFWMPCPVCGRMFGGHELPKKWQVPLLDEKGIGTCVCSAECSSKAHQMNKAKGRYWPFQLAESE